MVIPLEKGAGADWIKKEERAALALDQVKQRANSTKRSMQSSKLQQNQVSIAMFLRGTIRAE